ncbi:bifunctional 2-polyprenyl-6-hydroxyphenol methylase/3-demethylubiquinol 3-O-methyltransferase UbiG [Natrinema versiforme]|uniref:Class I SAM-dependent methyltransferase n=1 Tax=Natrinema versiforme TaxID=88724 RepID=A0A4V1FXW2_9EURY|nr:class I SAM-dependent methyltransferase [Natrinema versiforme]QCS41113.1 class I SAM-dependent methyltransferase [Natrinema versiforme]
MNSNEVRRQWAERSGAYSPEYYAYYGPDHRSESIHGILDRFVDRDAAVLELGCSSGRHLAHLYEHGFENLHGIDVNDDAFDVMEETYPDLAAGGTFYHDTIEDTVGDFADGRFDIVYSVETLQHIHPDAEWVLEDLTRITDDLLITVENEGDDDGSESDGPDVSYVNDDFPLYHRDWNRVFTDLGLLEVDAESGKRDTVRAFRTREE